MLLLVARLCWYLSVLSAISARGLDVLAPLTADIATPQQNQVDVDDLEGKLTRRTQEVEEKEKEMVVRKRAMEKLQEVFGLGVSTAHHSQVPPQFMTELYKTIADPSGVTRGSNPFGATVVRSFIERDNSRSHFFSFNISGMDPTEKVLEAELHLYRMRSAGSPAFNSPHYLIRVFQVVNASRLDSPDIHRLLNMRYVGAGELGWQVFNVTATVASWVKGSSPNLGLLVTSSTLQGDRADLRFARRDQQHNSKQPILVLFNDDGTLASEPEVTTVPNPLANYPTHYKYQSDDLIDDVAPESSRRRRSPCTSTSSPDNLSATSPAKPQPSIPSPHLRGPSLLGQAETMISPHPSIVQQVTITTLPHFSSVQHSNNTTSSSSTQSSTTPHQSSPSVLKEAETTTSPPHHTPSSVNPSTSTSATHPSLGEHHPTECSRHELYVEFGKIDMFSGIIAPLGYFAYNCQGHCRFPVDQGQKTTNHAKVRSIVHELHLHRDVGRPCCVPTRLLPITLLSFDGNNNVVLKKYRDMVAESCGCL